MINHWRSKLFCISVQNRYSSQQGCVYRSRSMMTTHRLRMKRGTAFRVSASISKSDKAKKNRLNGGVSLMMLRNVPDERQTLSHSAAILQTKICE